MRKFTKTIACGVLCTLMLTGCGQTEAPEHPIIETTITETTAAAVVMIEIKGGAEILSVPEDVRALELTCREQMESLQGLAAELAQLEEIQLTGFVPKAGEILQLEEVFENVHISCDQVEILGKAYPADLEEIDLTELNRDDIPVLGQELKALKNLQAVRLSPEGETGSVSLDDAAVLHELCPELTYHYSVELFGQVLSTDMKEVSYFKTSIGDAGLEEFRKLLPLMHDLDRLVLDWCGTSNEATAQLRDEFADSCSVVWRVFFGRYNCLTDTYKIWANGLLTVHAEVLKYCTEVRYIDLGHSAGLGNVDFLAYMPKIQVVILGDCTAVTSIEPMRNCLDLEYIEIFSVKASDLSPLENLTKLEHLNISRVPANDLSPIMGLSNLKRLWSNGNPHLEAQVAQFQEKYPDCQVVTKGGNSVSYQWRYTDSTRQYYAPRYALLRAQIGYSDGEMSFYPRGYLREEITYESTGISPVEGHRVTD